MKITFLILICMLKEPNLAENRTNLAEILLKSWTPRISCSLFFLKSVCHVSRVTCHVSPIFYIYFFYKVVKLVSGAVLSTGPTPSSFSCCFLTIWLEDCFAITGSQLTVIKLMIGLWCHPQKMFHMVISHLFYLNIIMKYTGYTSKSDFRLD